MSTRLMNVLVTGGAGFLGTNLCGALLQAGHEVLCLDNLSTGRIENIAPLISSPHFNFLQHDVTVPIKLKVDRIYNLACPASPIHYQKDPLSTLQASVLGTINMLNLARECGARLLQASTSEIYGDPLVHPQPESYWGNVNPIGPRACYDEGKRCAETLCFDYHRQYGVEIKVARIFNTYGPFMHPHDGRMVANFIVQALQGLDLTVYGDGSQTRSMCYVDDTLRGLVSLMESGPDFTGPVNIGNDEEYSVIEVARMIIRATGSNSRIKFFPRPIDDPELRRPLLDLALKSLNWQPQVPLSQGLANTITYFRSLIKSSL